MIIFFEPLKFSLLSVAKCTRKTNTRASRAREKAFSVHVLGVPGCALESICDSIAPEILGAHPPVLSPALAADIGGGRFTAHILANDVTNGISPFRLLSTTLHDPEAAARQLRNSTTYMVVGLGRTGVAQADATAMVLANNDIMLPTTSAQFRALLEG
jgi:hypothetical protein